MFGGAFDLGKNISIHTLHTEGDPSGVLLVVMYTNFNPHPPHGG